MKLDLGFPFMRPFVKGYPLWECYPTSWVVFYSLSWTLWLLLRSMLLVWRAVLAACQILLSRRGVVVRSVGAVTFSGEGPDYDSPPACAFGLTSGRASGQQSATPLPSSPPSMGAPYKPRLKWEKEMLKAILVSYVIRSLGFRFHFWSMFIELFPPFA